MQSAPEHEQEALRIAELMRLEVLDSEDEAVFDELTELASTTCGTSISLISLIDTDRQWFKSRVGLEARETPRNIAFCSHAILQPNIFEVQDTLKDKRFFDNLLVTSNPNIRFYAGAPLITEQGLPLGTLCVIDQQPKVLTDQQKRALSILANQVIGQLELRLKYKQLSRIESEREKIYAVMGHDLRAPFNGVIGLARILNASSAKLSREKIQSMAANILESTLQVFQVIDELMQWTQQRLGNIKSVKEVCRLYDMVIETVNLVSVELQLKQLQCDMTVDESVEVLADAAIVKTILRNTITNAIKYSKKGGSIKIDASVNNSVVIISITDEGNGIPPAIAENLFKDTVESQIDTEGIKGSGIGLSLCAELIATQQGKIWIDQSYQKGAKISFSLPVFDG